MRKLVSCLLAVVVTVCFFLLIGFAGSLEWDRCTISEYLTRSGITVVVLWASMFAMSRIDKDK